MRSAIKTYLTLFILMAVLPGVAQASGLEPFKGESGVLRIAGGTAHIPVMKAAAKQIMSYNSDIQITIAGGGSGVGIKQVGEGLVDIGNSGRKPSETEISKYGLSMYKWAIDGVCPVVNPKNPVQALTSDQLKDIYAGRITNWKEVGGVDRSINVYTRDASSGTRAVFWKKALAKGDISGKSNFIGSNGAMKSAIGNDPFGLGYVSVGYLDKGVAPVALDNVMPGLDTVKSGEYKVARGLYSNTKGPAQGLAKKFIDFILGPDGQKIAGQKGFIPVN